MADRQFGPYSLVQQIAVGGMAEIHLAKTSGIAGFEKYVALKMIHPNFSQDQQFIQMLIDEAKITVQLQHVNIAQTFDLGRVGDTYYITMEFVDGADLYKLLRKTAENDDFIPIPVSAHVAKEVATGLDYAHRKRDVSGQPLRIVHRDVSPQNVLISHAGEVKLVDFGIAKATMRARQTAVGVIKGKYYYMSPEQAYGDKLDHRTDVFSAGILLYEMLTGQMLYLEEDLHKLLDMVRKAEIPPPSTINPKIPPQLERIVMHALEKKPEDRYQTAADFAIDLERFLHVYAPVFTASKVADFVDHALEELEPLPEPVPEPSPKRARRPTSEISRNTQRIKRDQLVQARSEFTDENSVIYDINDLMAGRGGGSSFDTASQEVTGDMLSTGTETFPGGVASLRPRGHDDYTMPAGDFVTSSGRDAGDATRQIGPAGDVEWGGEESADFTMISDPPSFAALGNEATEFDPGIHGEPTAQTKSFNGKTRDEVPSFDSEGDDGPTKVHDSREKNSRPKTPAKKDRYAGLEARNPEPAVSSIREPKKSRRTPARGVPSARSLLSKAVSASVSGQRPTSGDNPTKVPNAAFSGRTQRQLDSGYPLVAKTPSPSLPPGLDSRQFRAFEVDEIPEAFKVGRGSKRAWYIGAAIIGVVGAIIYFTLFATKPEPPTAVGSISVVSSPSGAKVTIDGNQLKDTSPATMMDAKPGQVYEISVDLPGHELWQIEYLVPEGGGRHTVVAQLETVKVTLEITSEPEDAEVFVNGRSVGRTPFKQKVEPDNATTLELRAKDHRPVRRTLNWDVVEDKKLHIPLPK